MHSHKREHKGDFRSNFKGASCAGAVRLIPRRRAEIDDTHHHGNHELKQAALLEEHDHASEERLAYHLCSAFVLVQYELEL